MNGRPGFGQFLGPSLALAQEGDRRCAQPSRRPTARGLEKGGQRSRQGAKRPPHARAPESGTWRGGKAPRRGLTGVRSNGSSPAPPRSVGALGWAPREPQPFPGGGPGGAPAPAPTGARRVQECDQPDSPAPPSYLPPPHKAVHSPPRRPPPLQPALPTVRFAAPLQPSRRTEFSAGRARVRAEVGAASHPAGAGDTGAEREGSSRSSGRTTLAPPGPRAARGRCPFWDLGGRRS